jgi:hypothetical protein
MQRDQTYLHVLRFSYEKIKFEKKNCCRWELNPDGQHSTSWLKVLT